MIMGAREDSFMFETLKKSNILLYLPDVTWTPKFMLDIQF